MAYMQIKPTIMGKKTHKEELGLRWRIRQDFIWVERGEEDPHNPNFRVLIWKLD